MVGYLLKNTVSANGTVSRGVCQVENGHLTGVKETLKIRLDPDGTIVDEVEGTLSPDTVVSMNFWGFMPSFLSGGFSVLGGAFGSFAASDFFSGAVWLPSFVFSSGIVFLLYRKMGTKNALQVGTQNNAQIYRPRSAQKAAR